MSNLNDIREKKTPITLNGEVKNLLFDLNAFAELEENYGSVESLFNKLAEASPKAIINALWAGLLHDNPEIDKKTVGKMVHVSEMSDILNILFTALSLSVKQPDSKEDKGKNEQSPIQ